MCLPPYTKDVACELWVGMPTLGAVGQSWSQGESLVVLRDGVLDSFLHRFRPIVGAAGLEPHVAFSEHASLAVSLVVAIHASCPRQAPGSDIRTEISPYSDVVRPPHGALGGPCDKSHGHGYGLRLWAALVRPLLRHQG